MRVIVDVMGGDNAPLEMVKGAVAASKEVNASFMLVGDRNEIDRIAAEEGYDLRRFDIVHTPVFMTMEDDPLSVVRAKKDSSMSIGLRLLSEGKGDVFVSTGNTGALFTGATLIVRKVRGIQRAAIGTVLPTAADPCVLLDAGANVTVTDEQLEQFAVMGSAYMQKMFDLEAPRVGLLNNGTEYNKGNPLQIETYQLLSESGLNFVGNIEGKTVPFDTVDVLVTDGYTGNIFLKSIEGMGKFMLELLKDVFYTNLATQVSALTMKEKIKKLKQRFDANEHGGAPILGLRSPVIKAHGSSDANAIKNAVRQAISYVETGINEDIRIFAEDYDEKKILADAERMYF